MPAVRSAMSCFDGPPSVFAGPLMLSSEDDVLSSADLSSFMSGGTFSSLAFPDVTRDSVVGGVVGTSVLLRP